MKNSKLKVLGVLALAATLFACTEPQVSGNPTSTAAPTSAIPATGHTVKTLAELNALESHDATQLFEVEGVWKATGASDDQYGNGFLVDEKTGDSIEIYGMAPTKDAFTLDETTSAYTFTNPKTFQELKTTLETGDKIKALVSPRMYSEGNFSGKYYSSYVGEIAGKEHFAYSVTKNIGENGTASLSAEKGIYGTEITLTTAPAENYKVNTVKLNDTAIAPSSENTYKFNIDVYTNNLEVTFISLDYKNTTFEIDAAGLGLTNSYVNTATEAVITNGGYTTTFNWKTLMDGGKCIQSRIKDSDSGAIWNTTALEYDIASVTIVRNAAWVSATSTFSVAFASSAMTEAPNAYNGTFTSSSELTVECTTEGAKYIRFDHTVKGAVYIDKIIITYKA